MQGTNSSYFSFSFHEAERKYLTWLWPSPTSDPPLGTLLHVSLLWTASLVQFICFCLGSHRFFSPLKVQEKLAFALSGEILAVPLGTLGCLFPFCSTGAVLSQSLHATSRLVWVASLTREVIGRQAGR